MIVCPNCKNNVEPRKGNADLIGLGGLLLGPIGWAIAGVSGMHHYMKLPRCPICNIEIRGYVAQ